MGINSLTLKHMPMGFNANTSQRKRFKTPANVMQKYSAAAVSGRSMACHTINTSILQKQIKLKNSPVQPSTDST